MKNAKSSILTCRFRSGYRINGASGSPRHSGILTPNSRIAVIYVGVHMRLSALICDRYRTFKERQRIDLAPITLIIGRNGSGKSVLSRLPLLLANAVSDAAEGPLDLRAGNIEHAASFQDLVNARGALPFTLGAEITDGQVALIFETTLRYVRESKSLAIEQFTLRKDQSEIFKAELAGEDQLEATEPKFNIVSREYQAPAVTLSFAGLFPRMEGLPGNVAELLRGTLTQFREALPKPSYLGPFRAEPSRAMGTPNQSIRELGPRGEKALEILADDRLRHGGELARNVSEWFSHAMGQGIEVDVAGDLPQIRVAEASTGFHVSLADTGAGFSQCLPVVVQHFAYRAGRIKSPIMIVEQPELHLHPAAHGAVADLIVRSAAGDARWPSGTCIVETHSEQFIMRVRRRIAEGLSPRLVRLWSLDHRETMNADVIPTPLRAISFDERGNPDAWPAGVFEEALTDLTAMRRSARERGL